jgi:hypothetical protein
VAGQIDPAGPGEDQLDEGGEPVGELLIVEAEA